MNTKTNTLRMKKLAVEKLVEDAREYQRQEASKIVVPGSDQGGIVMP